MINIFFVPGMFGSAVEYILKNTISDSDILPDGSMHLYKKEMHIINKKQLTKSLQIEKPFTSTIIYPGQDNKLEETLGLIPRLTRRCEK